MVKTEKWPIFTKGAYWTLQYSGTSGKHVELHEIILEHEHVLASCIFFSGPTRRPWNNLIHPL